LTEPHSLAVLRVLRRCLRFGLRLRSGPASNQPCGQPSWTRLSSSHRLPVLRRCLRFGLRLAFGPASDQPRGRPLGTRQRLSLPAPALRRCRWLGLRLALDPASNWISTRVLFQLIRPEPATSHRLSILWPPSHLGSDSRPSASTLRFLPFPWPFGFALSPDSRPLPQASLSG